MQRRLAAGTGLLALAIVLIAVLSRPSREPLAGFGATGPPGPGPSQQELESIPIESGPPAGPDRIARENLHAGTDKWQLPLTGTGAVEGYFDEVSVVPGETVGLRLRSATAFVNVSVFRLGSYAGLGARLVARYPNVPVRPQADPLTDPTTGMVTANWERALSITIPEDWVSGLYLAELQPAASLVTRLPEAATGAQYATLIVRERTPEAPILWLSAITTDEAYNPWGGKSLYPDNSSGTVTASGSAAAVTVSFDRPYADYRGAGRELRWEYPFIRWIERAGYDVAYAADLDLERDPAIATGRRLIMLVGHPEYWSVGMRRALEAAIASGTNVTFFSANEVYWRVRFDAVTRPYRTVTCYRQAALDPLAAAVPAQATTQWREPPAPDPESLLIGQMYGHQMAEPADWVVAQADHWIYSGTGLRDADHIANLVGQEYDQYWPDLSPPGVTILANSPVLAVYGQHGIAGTPAPNEPSSQMQNATIHEVSSGATVFAAGTFQWGWALDPWGNPEYRGVRTPIDPRVSIMTRNILDRLGG